MSLRVWIRRPPTSFGRPTGEKVRNGQGTADPATSATRSPALEIASVGIASVLAVFARLSQRQRGVEPVVTVGIDAQPLGWRRQPARRERAGNGGLTGALGGMPPAGARG